MAQLNARSVTPIVALDYPSSAEALRLVAALGSHCRFYKIGSELFTADGPRVVEQVRATGARVFLDLKFHDIPNTVAGAVRSATQLGVDLLTVHASGGSAMLRAAAEAGAGRVTILAVTVLTSLTAAEVSAAWGRDAALDAEAEVVRLAGLAADAGVGGIVCSGQEASAVRAAHGDRLELLIPGVRLAGGGTQDQARVVTPAQAAGAGATYVVIGRAVTGAADPVAAMRTVNGELAAAAP